ncbi:MAG: hypothetical protein AVDCRST_MAG39-1488, partial [uncultured Sphingomonadaceae bacterium]
GPGSARGIPQAPPLDLARQVGAGRQPELARELGRQTDGPVGADGCV